MSNLFFRVSTRYHVPYEPISTQQEHEMNAKLHKAMEIVLNKSDPATELRTADKEAARYRKHPSWYTVPQEFAYLEPLISLFVSEYSYTLILTERIRDYVRTSEGFSERYKGLRKFHRELVVRFNQMERRKRRTSLSIRLTKEFDLPVPMRDKVLDAAEKYWADQRERFLESVREQHAGKLTYVVREQVLAEFWQNVEREINAAFVRSESSSNPPLWSYIIGILQSL